MKFGGWGRGGLINGTQTKIKWTQWKDRTLGKRNFGHLCSPIVLWQYYNKTIIVYKNPQLSSVHCPFLGKTKNHTVNTRQNKSCRPNREGIKTSKHLWGPIKPSFLGLYHLKTHFLYSGECLLVETTAIEQGGGDTCFCQQLLAKILKRPWFPCWRRKQQSYINIGNRWVGNSKNSLVHMLIQVGTSWVWNLVRSMALKVLCLTQIQLCCHSWLYFIWTTNVKLFKDLHDR